MEELFAAVKYADTELHNRIKKEADKKPEAKAADVKPAKSDAKEPAKAADSTPVKK